jgi:spermidine synthase
MKTFKSKYNGILEVSWRNGRKVLDSANTNYSYDTVHQVWKKALKRIPLTGVENILVLGLGGGTLLELLTVDFQYNGRITFVEIDPVIVRIAEEEFGVKETPRVKIKCMDAFDYMEKARTIFDLVIVDIFIDNEMPENILSIEFWRGLAKKTKSNGRIVFNAFHYTSQVSAIREEMVRLGFWLDIYPKVNGSNTIIVASHAQQ